MAIEPSGITGVYAAAVSVFNSDFSLNATATLEHYEWLLDNGCDGVLIFGTTGEANSLSVAEKVKFLKEVRESSLPKDRLMVGTGSPALPDAVALTEAALAAGIHETLLLPPYYFKNPTTAGLGDFVRRLISKVNDEHLKLLLYHFPQMAGVSWPDDLTRSLVEEYNGTVVGMKDSSGDVEHMKGLLLDILGFRMFTGSESHLSTILDSGGPGTISATVNLTAPQAQKVFQAWNREEDTRELQMTLNAQRAAFDGLPLVSAIKAVLAQRRGKGGYRAVRPPFRPLTGEEQTALFERLERVGL